MDLLSIASTYYDAFRKKTDFSEVPIADSFVFRGPSGSIEGPAPFRGAVSGIAQALQALQIRHQHCEGNRVVTVYDFDMGLPDGPIPMAEVIQAKGGEIQEIELIFDPGRLPGPPA